MLYHWFQHIQPRHACKFIYSLSQMFKCSHFTQLLSFWPVQMCLLCCLVDVSLVIVIICIRWIVLASLNILLNLYIALNVFVVSSCGSYLYSSLRCHSCIKQILLASPNILLNLCRDLNMFVVSSCGLYLCSIVWVSDCNYTHRCLVLPVQTCCSICA